MDAYDIFKKLSRGATFSKEHNPKKNENRQIKVEKDPEAFIAPTRLQKQDREESSITLLSSLKAEDKKGKKRKRSSVESEERKRKLLKQEEVNHYRNINRISVVGKHVPEPARTFQDFSVDSTVIENLRSCGYKEPTPVQKQAVPVMLEGRNLLACAPTGSGKTAAFLVPIINDLEGPRKQGFRALILCPTRELAKQTQRECVRLSEGRGFRVHIISKINKALTQYGPNSSQKFGMNTYLILHFRLSNL